jgi:hypothetical protein
MIPKWRVFVRSLEGDSVILGRPMLSEEWASVAFTIQGVGVGADGSLVFGEESLEAQHVIAEPKSVSESVHLYTERERERDDWWRRDER